MRIWFDTEFVDTGALIIPLSIGMVREDGEELYAEFSQAWHARTQQIASSWVMEHVYPHLTGPGLSYVEIRERVLDFAGRDPEFWAYYADYDWVLLCQLFGPMVDLPAHWPKFCLDLKQEADMFGCSQFEGFRLPKQTGIEHHALHDARWTREAHLWLESMMRKERGL